MLNTTGILLICLLLSFSVPVMAPAPAQPPIVYSLWTDSAPVIDGLFMASEPWTKPQLELRPEDGFPVHALIYILNDWTNLYLLIDAADAAGGDYSEEARDHCAIMFHNPVDGVRVELLLGLEPLPLGCEGAIGFGPSPNYPSNHRIYEFKVPRAIVTLTRTGTRWLHFASPETLVDSLPYDYNSGSPRANIWPLRSNAQDYSTWGILYIAQGPVGGTVISTGGSLTGLVSVSVILVAVLCLAGALCLGRGMNRRPDFHLPIF